MAVQEPNMLEGIWEEILTHSDELAGRRVRVLILAGEPTDTAQKYPYSTAGALLKHLGKWSGKDFEERLAEVYTVRGKAQS